MDNEDKQGVNEGGKQGLVWKGEDRAAKWGGGRSQEIECLNLIAQIKMLIYYKSADL
jgi:hypothetical protein